MEISQTTCSIVVNGEQREVPSGLSVVTLLVHLSRDPEIRGVAVALNDAVVRKEDWSESVVENGDRVEIITASQGG